MVAGVMANPWKWTTLNTATEEVTVETPASYMVTFKDDGTVDIKADCNDSSGTYTLDGANVTIEVGAATLAACPGDSRSEQFLQLLGDAAQMLPLDGKLYISLKTEGSTMILDAVVTTVVDLCGDEAWRSTRSRTRWPLRSAPSSTRDWWASSRLGTGRGLAPRC